MKHLLPLFFIRSEKLRSPLYLSWLLLVLAAFVFVAFRMGSTLQLQADFTVFWQAGINFHNGVELYSRIGGAERYIYPPFAAMLFQVLALFPLKVAGSIWAFFNLLMWVLMANAMKQLLCYTSIQDKKFRFALLIAFFLSFRYFWYHLMFMQMNVLVLLLSIWALLFYLKNKPLAAVALLLVATGIKILPIVFLCWLLSKSGPKLWMQTLAMSLLILVIPFVWRGWEMGWKDLNDYYITFLEPFQSGRVEPKLQNYALSASIYKWFVPLSEPSPYFSPIYAMTAEKAGLIYKIVLLAFLLLFSVMLYFSRFLVQKISLNEVAFVLLFTNLVSGITWEYHLVSLLPVLVIYFCVNRNHDRWYQCIFQFIIIATLIFNAIVGTDTVGVRMYYISCGYSFPTVLMLLLLIDFSMRVFQPKREADLLLQEKHTSASAIA
ncbi:MAG: hypothetical protein RLZZ543_1008 [Bacteroidota bacterium]